MSKQASLIKQPLDREPLAHAHKISEAEITQPRANIATVKTVLIVDDEPPARMRLKAMVNALDDYQVIAEAENGQQAMAANKSSLPILSYWISECRKWMVLPQLRN